MSLILTLLKTCYKGLNLAHFIQKLQESHIEEFTKIASYCSIRNYFLKQGILNISTRRKPKIHRMRKRYEKEGIMVQIDGSHHR